MNRPISASAFEDASGGWTASRRTDVDQAVRTAGRHSIFVRILRIGVPLAIVLVAGGVGLFNYFKPMQIFDKLPSVSGKLAVQGSKITMELPRIAGFTRDSRSYEMTAETAVQDIATPDVVELHKLRVKMEMADKDVVNVTANGGTYNTKGDKVVLRDQIVVTSSQYVARLREAAIDMKGGNVTSDKPVEITLPKGLLTANGLEIAENGQLLRFNRGVVLTLDGDKSEAKQ
jgi:lipopolysaccharide export system protein LptC